MEIIHMKLSDDFDNEQIKSGISLGTMIVGVLFFIGIVVFAVFMANRKGNGNSPLNNPDSTMVQNAENDQQTNNTQSDFTVSQSTLVSDDLDFWDMYKEDDLQNDTGDAVESVDYAAKLKELEKEEAEKAKEDDPSENGTKTEVILPDGTSQWIMINAYIDKNTYDYTGLVCEEPFMRYYANAKKISRQGLKLDESYGSVNFEAVEKEGIDFCILRIGKRGYATGSVSYDNNFVQYATDAQAAGLSVGVSFYSQAVSVEEATEEANLTVAALRDNNIVPDYPVIFEMDYVIADESRTGGLTKQQLTDIAKAFCDTVKAAGYTPMIYGDKYWLLRKLDLTKLSGYNIDLSQDGDVPDYPYQFVMWDYNHEADIKGISQKVTMCISFVDYKMR